MAMVGRKPKLTPERAAELRRRYRLWYENRPKRLCAVFDVDSTTLANYVRGRHKRARV